MRERIDPKKVSDLIREKLGVEVQLSDDEANPMITGSVSLSRFGVVGNVMVWMDKERKYHAIGVPFGLGMDDKSHFEDKVA